MNPFLPKELSGTLNADQFDSVGITLASPETIRKWSSGEVKNPETINYRTFRPERDGLFCERIFGPTKDWECACGKYKRVKHKGVICDRCGVEVTVSRVRRERMGHIELAVPVSHIWFFKCNPSRIGLMLDMTVAALERVLYYEDYIVTDPRDTPLQPSQLISEAEYLKYQEEFGEGSFEAFMGAEAIKKLLARIDLDEMMAELEEEMANTRSKATKKKITKRMKVCDGFRRNQSKPEWMVLDVLPVIPPELRPLVPLEGGRFATSDLNDLYRRVINRNNRLSSLLQMKTPDVIIRNEKRMLQEAVDAVFDNGRHGRFVTGLGNRPLKSLSDALKGKTGRFRQNLLGKRVDYSGRSVIVVGPELKLWQCGLPKKMALVLFEPFIINRLKDMDVAHTVRSAKKLIEKQDDKVWQALEDVIKGKTVMLNRAPTLHRLSIQSFEPVLVEGEAIQLHPLCCTPFNADFDGDQMAVHVPLSVEAQLESRLLMLASNSIFSPASGKSVRTPTQDIALGIYYITSPSQSDRRDGKEPGRRPPNPEDHLKLFYDASEVHLAYDEGAVKIHDRIWFRNPDYRKPTAPKYGRTDLSVIETTVGRVFFNEVWPDGVGFINKPVNKSVLGDMIWECNHVAGHAKAIETLDAVKALGYANATLAGVSIGLVDMVVPPEKQEIIADASKAVSQIEGKYQAGLITVGERHNQVVDTWTVASDKVADVMYKAIENNEIDGKASSEINPIFMMVDSKARGSRQQIRQLAGMRGLMSNPSGEVIETPIQSNFREGLSVLEYFISSHGARKGLADTALKTADAGYLTRKLVDVSQDVIITEDDCNTINGIEVAAIMKGDKEEVPLRQRILGRTSLTDVYVTENGEPKVLVRANQIFDEEACDLIEKYDIKSVWIRSGLTCESRHGMCAKCYGRDLATGNPVEIGTAVGIIAAQSIGEPGTQLTMRTFHVGGTASTTFSKPEFTAKEAGTIHFEDLRTVRNRDGKLVTISKNGSIVVVSDKGEDRHSPQVGSILHVADGDKVKAGDVICTWDPYSSPIIAAVGGSVVFHDFVEGVSYEETTDAKTGVVQIKILSSRENLRPQIAIMNAEGSESARVSLPAEAVLAVKEGDEIFAGDVLARTPFKAAKTHDITGGLPRVAELFEARPPKDAAVIAKIEGDVHFRDPERNHQIIVIRDEITDTEETLQIPMSKHIVVLEGDHVKKGEKLTEGDVSPQELLEVCGPQELQRYLVDEVQAVYRLQGVEINDKHIEIIVRQMLRKVKITNPGDTEFLFGDQVSHQTRVRVNEKAIAEGKRPAEAAPALLGITKASLETDSFISAASFQDTTRVLTDAATLGRIDHLRGFKENVILGHLIPGGTGFPMNRNIKLVPLAEPISAEELGESREAVERAKFMKSIGDN